MVYRVVLYIFIAGIIAFLLYAIFASKTTKYRQGVEGEDYYSTDVTITQKKHTLGDEETDTVYKIYYEGSDGNKKVLRVPKTYYTTHEEGDTVTLYYRDLEHPEYKTEPINVITYSYVNNLLTFGGYLFLYYAIIARPLIYVLRKRKKTGDCTELSDKVVESNTTNC